MKLRVYDDIFHWWMFSAFFSMHALQIEEKIPYVVEITIKAESKDASGHM